MNSIRIALFACATLMASTAFASSDEVRSEKVSLSGLDLSQPAGAEHAYRRIRSAAQSVCRDLQNGSNLHSQAWKTCVAESIARAVTDVNSPVLTAYYVGMARKAVRVASR